MKWKFIKSGFDEDCELFGVNIFNYKWKNIERIELADPRYDQTHLFTVWEVNIDGIVRTFAAGEFSNGVWGFYLPE